MTDSPKFEYSVAIQTRFDGRHFRSRLEAKWAVFFKYIGLAYQYEPEGFALVSGDRYQPDFLLPDVYLRRGTPGLYLEVKPVAAAIAPLFETYSEFGSGRRGYRYGEDEIPPPVGDADPNERNFVILVGEVGIHCDNGEGHYQFGPWWDRSMSWHCCHECGATKLDFFGGGYYECPRCGGESSNTQHPILESAQTAARSMRFDRSGGARR